MKTLRGKMSRVSAMLLAVMMMLLSVQWDNFESTQAEAADVAYKYFEMNFDDPGQLNGDPFYLYSQDGVQGCEVQNGVLVKNGKHPIFGLSMYEKYGENGKLTAQFDLRAERGASRTAPWNTVYFGLRQPTDQATGYMSGGIWLSFKDNTIGFRFNTWALTTEMTVPINISDSRHKIYIEDDQDANRINIWVDDVHEATLVIQQPSTISIYDASGNLVETQEVAHEITKGGFITWWCHDLETMEMDNVKVWMPEVSTDPYVPVDESLIQDTYMDTWVAADDLGRLSPTYDEVGGVKEDKMVGMFYFLTHDGYSTDATDHYAAYQSGGIDGIWNSLSRTGEHFWGRPYFGYYRSDDEWVIRKHATMMVEAGIDFIFFDCSNNILYPGTTNKILETYREMREEGLQTPQVMWFLNDREDFTANSMHRLYDEIYKDGKYSDLWVMWEGKPLIMVNPNGADSSVPMEFFTIRRSWAFESYGPYQEADGKGFWQWADVYPQAPGYSTDGTLEQMVVMSGFWANGNGGRSNTRKYPYHSTEKFSYPQILGDNFEMHRVENGTSAKGAGYQEQFDFAQQVDPPVLLLVGWNEWKAGSQGLGAGMGQDIANTYVIDGNAPHYQFTDCFNPEFARDIEPMTGGYSDAYYYQTVNNVREFEGVRQIPTNNDAVAINMQAGFAQWEQVQTEYYDTPNDTTHRNMISAYLEGRYINTTGRNDLRTAKVAYDSENVYFYIDTEEAITAAEGQNWMNLFIDTDKDASTGWKGYDLILNRSRDGSYVSVEQSIGNAWNWQEIGRAEYAVSGNQMMIKLPNTLSGLNASAAFDFKWADNSTTDGTVEQFMDLGDAAPDNRFNFRVVRNSCNLSENAFSHLGSFTLNMAVDSDQAFQGYQKIETAAPFREGETIYVPLEQVCKDQYVTYSFNGTTATIQKLEDIITINMGDSHMNTNQGALGSFDTAMPGTARAIDGVVYIPLESAAFALERQYFTNGDLIQIGGKGITRADNDAAKELLEAMNAEIVVDPDGIYTGFTKLDNSAQTNWVYREVNDPAVYADRFSGSGLLLDWEDTALRGIFSKLIYSDYRMTAQIRKGSDSYWTSIQLGLPQDERLDMWENVINEGPLIGGTGLQVAVGGTKAVVGLMNGVEDAAPVYVEIPLEGIDTTAGYTDVSVTLIDNVYEIYIGGQFVATVTLDKDSIASGHMELRREMVNNVLTPIYADSSVKYYTSGTIHANGEVIRFTDKAVAVTDAASGNGTFGFSTRAQEFWVKNVVLTDLSGSTSELKGDVNADGAVTVADVISLQRYLLDTISLTSGQCTRADMTSDGTLNGFDLAILKRVLLNG